ncbi:MAG: hypothetical protein AB1896_01185 [Thermodesulfobacteriota bacterium]
MRKVLLIWTALFFLMVPLAPAADPAALMREASSAYIDGDYLRSLEKIQEALEVTWNLAPLSVRHVTFVSDPPEAYGLYEPRESDEFDSVEPVQLYCEPVGFTVKHEGDWYLAALSADFSLADEKGAILGGQPGFYQWQGKSRNFNSEVMMFFTINLKGLAAGRYKLLVTLIDQNSDKKVTFEKAVTIK